MASRMGSWLRLLLLMSLASNVFAADAIKDSSTPLALLSKFKPLTVASGTFVQNKYFTVLKNPVTSTGELYLDQALGFVWHTSKPIASTLLLKQDGLYSVDHRQQQKKINNATPIATVLMSALSGDVAALESEFTLVQKPPQKGLGSGSENICLQLTPKDPVIAKVMRIIELCGKDTVEHLVLFETSGNRTEIAINLTEVDELPKEIREQL